MHNRKPINPETIKNLSTELTGLPVDDEKAQIHAEVFETLMKKIELLRSLPIKDIEPAVVFRPVKRSGGDSS